MKDRKLTPVVRTPTHDEILAYLRSAPDGLTSTEIRERWPIDIGELGFLLVQLQARDLARPVRLAIGERARWKVGPATDGDKPDRIARHVLEALRKARVEGQLVKPVEVETGTQRAVTQVLRSLGGEWRARRGGFVFAAGINPAERINAVVRAGRLSAARLRRVDRDSGDS